MTKFWIGGSGNWSDTTHWSITTGGASGAAVPTSSDDVTIDSNSGTTPTITVDVAANANSITINKSDATLLDNAGMTVVGAVTLTIGALNTNGKTEIWGSFSSNNTNTRTLTLGASSITVSSTGTSWNINNATGLIFSGASSTITITGASAQATPASGLTYGTIIFNGSGTPQLNGSITLTNLTRTGTAVTTDGFNIVSNITITGTLTLAGNSSVNRLAVQTNGIGSQKTITNTGATMVWSNVNLMDIALTTPYNASAITGNSGDCGGNSGITFTPASTQTWAGTTSGNWSTNAWTTHAPLPQDTVIINAAFPANQLITADMTHLGKDINFTGTTGNPQWKFNIGSLFIFGSVTLVPSMNFNGAQGLTFAGRGTHTITSAGQTWPTQTKISGTGGTYTLQDDMITTNALTINTGAAFNANGHNTQFTTVQHNVGTTLTMGTGICTLTSTSTGNIFAATSSGFSGASSTIVIANASANTRTFAGGGLSYGTLTYTITGSSGELDITGSNTFNTINCYDNG